MNSGTLPVLVLRPEPGCTATVAALHAMGLEVIAAPLFAIAPVCWDVPDLAQFDAVLIGSANALRHGGEALRALQGMPTYAVGTTTAAAARAAGLAVVATGEGGLQVLLEYLDPGHRHLLRLAGRERIALEPQPGVTVTDVVVYASDTLPLSPAAVEALRHPAVVLLHSGEAARHFAAQCDLLAIDRRHLRIAAIGARVAAACGPGWEAVRAAPRPDEQALLALALDMCQTLPGRSA